MTTEKITFKRLKKLGEKAVEHAKSITLPLFDGVPLYDVAMFFWRSIVDGAITTRASGIAFSFFLALFPGIIFLFTLIPSSGFEQELFTIIKELVPEKIWPVIEETITAIVLKDPGRNVKSINFLMALIFATNGFVSMMSAFDATVHNINRRTWWSQYLAAVVLLIIFTLLLVVAIAMLTGGQALINYLDQIDIIRDKFLFYLLTVGKWIITITIFFFAFSFLYYMAPAKKTKWRFISAGGTLATVLSIFGFIGMSYYLNNFSQYNILYGSIGTLLAVLLLMYVMSLILLIGFELNASIYQAHTYQNED
ncbi:YihY/virulence factor BrkB family protein [Draconibacterium sp. IB214405]|uniref:YihY/virulence factor BrkB family protein n=1 Tax=Draconibacterium sp. IB214405 TaxID=3097352 RepID=UPI002A179A42|nr:YihY/virulence factor BrkB family protein [Draconibacterium sp. IB214405]MDX8341504.1 YihY/virulence factor BrkB family protein [Draconibacterium sp. IB214405]